VEGFSDVQQGRGSAEAAEGLRALVAGKATRDLLNPCGTSGPSLPYSQPDT
jgi:hypothetical protein